MELESPPYVWVYARDWISDPRYQDLPPGAMAAFCNLVLSSYTRGGVLPDDMRILRKCSLVEREVFDEAWPLLIAGGARALFKKVDAVWFNPKARKCHDEALDAHRKKSRRGKKGARSRWEKEESPPSKDAQAYAQAHAQAYGKGNATSNGNSELGTLSSDLLALSSEEDSKSTSPRSGGGGRLFRDESPPDPDPEPEVDDGPSPFEQAWKPWLRVKRNADQKAAAKKAFDRAAARLWSKKRCESRKLCECWLRDQIIDGVAVVEKLRAEGEVPHLKTWLNDERYDHDGDGFTEAILGGRRARGDDRRAVPARTARNIGAMQRFINGGE